MHQFATFDRLKAGLDKSGLRCDNFIEVRGQPSLEGHFGSLAMLLMFVDTFGLIIKEQPESRQVTALYDPSDFSHMSSRIVLAHKGLVAFASMTRTHDQVFHCPKDEGDFQRVG